MFCPKCGKEMPEGATVCPECGYTTAGTSVGAVFAKTNLPAGKSHLVNWILGVWLGMVGVHDFYAGNSMKGVAHIVVTVLGMFLLGLGPLISWVWAIIEVWPSIQYSIKQAEAKGL